MAIQLSKVISGLRPGAHIGLFQARFAAAWGENRVRRCAVGKGWYGAGLRRGAAVQQGVHLC